MCINVSRPRLNLGVFQYRFVMQKFRFSVPHLLSRFPFSKVISSWPCRLCTVWWRRFLKSPHKVENASELQLTSISDQYLLYVFMNSWVYNGAPQPCFSRCMVDYTLMTDQMTTIFVFHFIWGHVPGGWISYQYSRREGPLVISMKNIPFQNDGQNNFWILCNNANLCLLARKLRGRLNFLYVSKEAYPIVRQLEKITVKKVQAKVVKCAKNKSWVPRNPPWSLKS